MIPGFAAAPALQRAVWQRTTLATSSVRTPMLRCQIAMGVGGAFTEIQKECEPMSQLSTRPR